MHAHPIRDLSRALALACSLLVTVSLVQANDLTKDQTAFFENEVRPVLVENCIECHGVKKRESGLRLDSVKGLRKGGDSGPTIVAGDVEGSLLVKAIRREDGLEMPPDRPLSDLQVAALTKWVKLGAQWPEDLSMTPVMATSIRSGPITDAERGFWSFQPIVRPHPAIVSNADWCRSPIDRFVLSKLQANQLPPASDADRRTLIRRATFDLTGLPPTPEEIRQFLNDDSPNAFAAVVDRLLESPRYGERWGRHWLDIVRYADTAGETADFPVPLAWRYRNYVIDAFNNDKPYVDFLREQIAGDIYAKEARNRHAELVIATGFLAVARRFGFGVAEHMHLTIQDTIDTTGQVVLGLSLGCAKCHDHKYDPVTVDDYYAWYGIFDSTRFALSADEKTKKERDLVPLIPFDEAVRIDEERDARGKQLADQLTSVHEELLQTQSELGSGDSQQNETADGRVVRALARSQKLATQIEAIKQEQLTLTGEAYEFAYAVREGEPHDAPIHKRGDHKKLGETVARRHLEILGGVAVQNPQSSSGRLDLAEWLAAEDNPLTARVIVNRLWLWHFGRGIVTTPNDFGVRGAAPSHPKLLDWLATELMENGWSIKHMHRVIMNSRVYQLSSRSSDNLSPADELSRTQDFGRFPQRRLDAESIRDAMLAISGRLDRTPGKEHPFPSSDKWGYTQHDPFYAVYETNKRSVYVMRQRLKAHPFFSLFDAADPSVTTGTRVETTTPTQALFLLNSPFVHASSVGCAIRILDATQDGDQRVSLAFELAFGREPNAAEAEAGLDFVRGYARQLEMTNSKDNQDSNRDAWAAFCRSLLVSNDFLFLE